MKLKSIFALLLAALLVLSAGGCKKENTDSRIYFALPDVPNTVDPQTASTTSELVVVRNLYEGLLRKDADGNIVSGVAERYEVDGLTYTFYLRKDAHWDTGDALTADDFVFGLQRAVDPATACPTADRFRIIDGAAAVLSGTAKTSALNVKAVDRHTLTVTLAQKSDRLPELLTTAASMPCNRAYFEKAGGKYGLSQPNVLCNGSYYMARWNQTQFGIRLKRNAEYYGDFTAQNAEVFLSCDEDGNSLHLLTDGDVDLALLYGSQATEAEKKGFRTASVENICWVLTVGSEYSDGMRTAFALSIDRENLLLPDGFCAADSFFPAVLNQPNAKGVGLEYNLEEAKKKFSAAVQNSEDGFPKTVLYYDGTANPDIQKVITAVVSHWQQYLNAFVNIEPAKFPDSLPQQLQEQTVQMAVLPLTVTDGDLAQYLTHYGVAGTDAAAIQQKLLTDNRIIPLAFEKTCLSYSTALSGVTLEPGNGYIDFSFIRKQD